MPLEPHQLGSVCLRVYQRRHHYKTLATVEGLLSFDFDDRPLSPDGLAPELRELRSDVFKRTFGSGKVKESLERKMC